MIDFQEVLEDCQLCDLGFKGPKFTWNNGLGGATFTKERLDRATANTEWRASFPAMDVTVLAKWSSDHHPIFVCLNEKWGLVWRKKNQFRVEVGWCVRDDYKRAIHATWIAGTKDADPWGNISGKLKRCQKATMVWVKKTMQVTEALIAGKTRKLAEIQQG
jgi:hypothetical protein